VVVQVTLKGQSESELSEFEQAVNRCDSVLRCLLMSGSDDYLLILLVRDLVDFERVHKMQLSRLPHVARIQSSFALRDVVRRALPADLLSDERPVGPLASQAPLPHDSKEHFFALRGLVPACKTRHSRQGWPACHARAYQRLQAEAQGLRDQLKALLAMRWRDNGGVPR